MRVARWVVIGLVTGVLAVPAEGRAPLTTKASVGKARTWAAGRDGEPSFAVVTEAGKVRGLDLTRTYPSASVTKAMLLVAVLRAARGRELTGAERGLLTPMIERSNNKAARALFAFHGPPALLAVAETAGMRHFSIALSLFEARIAAGGPGAVLRRASTAWSRSGTASTRGSLLSSVVSYQRWGIAPAAERHHLTPYFKGGWRKGIAHQVALLRRGRRRIAIAVLTNGPTQAYGRATIEGIAERGAGPAGPEDRAGTSPD